jgi:1,4-dihydroxy-2-naphthoyl-CoA hydrolase
MSEPGGPQLPGFAARIGIELLSATASVGAWLAVEDRGQQVVGLANATEALRAHTSGRLLAHARPKHAGEREQLWSAEVRRAGDDALAASGQVRLWHVAGHPEGWRSR